MEWINASDSSIEKADLILDYEKLSPEMEDLRNKLDEYVIWQEEAKNQIIDALSRTMILDNNRIKPIANLMFLGPTWVWKTEIPRALAKILYNDENRDLKETKIDCNNYQHDHEISDLIGAPVWYLWFWKEPRFSGTNIFKKFNKARSDNKLHPIISSLDDFAILIFDEIEKAHPALFNLMLNILDEWKITLKSGEDEDNIKNDPKDKKGKYSKYTNFKNVIIIMTSNLWAADIQKKLANKWTMWFTRNNENIIDRAFYAEKLKEHYSGEFINRITEFVPFKELSKDELKQRLDLEVKRFNKNLVNIVEFSLSENVANFLADEAFDSKLGWRFLINKFDKDIKTKINKVIWNGEISRIETYKEKINHLLIDYVDNEYIIKAELIEKLEQKTFSRRVKEANTKLLQWEVILSLKNWSLIETLNEIIIPNLEYLKILYIEREHLTVDFESEIKEIKEILEVFWVPEKDFEMLENYSYLNRMSELEEMYLSYDKINFLWKNTSKTENIKNRVIKKITETNLFNQICYLNANACSVEEIIAPIKDIVKRYLKRELTTDELNIIVTMTHKEYLTNTKSEYHQSKENKVNNEKKWEEKKTEEKKDEKAKESTTKAPENTAAKNITINLNFNLWNQNISEDETKKLIEIRANLFNDNMYLVLHQLKQSVSKKENDEDLVLIFEDLSEVLKKELWNLNQEQSNLLNDLINAELKKLRNKE